MLGKSKTLFQDHFSLLYVFFYTTRFIFYGKHLRVINFKWLNKHCLLDRHLFKCIIFGIRSKVIFARDGNIFWLLFPSHLITIWCHFPSLCMVLPYHILIVKL